MTGKVCAGNVFGQVLISLRMSRLDFLVTETLYAAYVTIRKKFMKSVNVQVNVIDSSSNTLEENSRMENSRLKEKLKDLQTECALTKFENEE